jgi:hypothetical protein
MEENLGIERQDEMFISLMQRFSDLDKLCDIHVQVD